MNYLEVKHEVKQKDDLSASDFISNVISSQQSLGVKIRPSSFEHDKLIELGFVRNTTTQGYGISKELSLHEIKNLALEVDKLDNHILTHGYIVIKVHEGEVYFWDTALIYEGVDSFEYCLKYHNTFRLGNVNVVTKSDTLNEELLNLANYTKRYNEPSLDFITQGCVWDKKEGMKILKGFIDNINDYIPSKAAIAY